METYLKLAETADELVQVWQARHRVYVEECAYVAAPGDGLLRDAFDGLARTANAIVVRHGRVLAGARMVVGLREPLPTDGRFDFSPYLPGEPTKIASGGFFFADPSLRGTPWVPRLVRFAHRWAFARGARYSVVVAAPRAFRTLSAAGYELMAPPYVEAGTGLPCMPLRVDLRRALAPRPTARRLEMRP